MPARKKPDKLQVLATRLHPDSHAQIIELAQAQGINKAMLVRLTIENFLSSIEKPPTAA